MRIKELVKFIPTVTERTVCLLGPPGIGKSSVGRIIAQQWTERVKLRNPDAPDAVCVVLDLSSMLPEDLMGLPFRDNDATRYCPPEWLHSLCEEGAYGVLVIDDLPAASPAIQVACRQIALERRVHEHQLSDGIVVIVTGNRRQDKSSANTLPAHFRNSVMMLQVDPDLDEWAEWYYKQGWDPIVPAFLRYKPAFHSMTPDHAGENGSFPTPRSWAFLGSVLESAIDHEHVLEVATGLVGEGVATEFEGFRRTRQQLADPLDVLRNPEKAIPDPGKLLSNKPDRMISLCSSLAEVTVALQKDKEKRVAAKIERPSTAMLNAASWVTQSEKDYITVVLTTYVSLGGDTPALYKSLNDDEALSSHTKKTLAFIKKAVKG